MCLIKVSHSLLARNDLTFNSTVRPKAPIVFILKEFNEEYCFWAQFKKKFIELLLYANILDRAGIGKFQKWISKYIVSKKVTI